MKFLLIWIGLSVALALVLAMRSAEGDARQAAEDERS